jgi:hypothetical protein
VQALLKTGRKKIDFAIEGAFLRTGTNFGWPREESGMLSPGILNPHLFF